MILGKSPCRRLARRLCWCPRGWRRYAADPARGTRPWLLQRQNPPHGVSKYAFACGSVFMSVHARVLVLALACLFAHALDASVVSSE